VEELGAVRKEGSRLVATRSLDATLVPDTIQDVITARIGRLPETSRRALRTAAVIGREFTRRLMDRVFEPVALMDGALRELRAVELIHEQRLFPEVSYAFKHALTHEIAYASIPADERRGLHHRIALALETLMADRLVETAGVLARHYMAGEDWERALVNLVRAAEAAARALPTAHGPAPFDDGPRRARRLARPPRRLLADPP